MKAFKLEDDMIRLGFRKFPLATVLHKLVWMLNYIFIKKENKVLLSLIFTNFKPSMEDGDSI